jgi:hypothetical protein
MAELEQNRNGKIAAGQMLKLAARALKPFYASAAVLSGWLIFLFIIRTLVPDLALKLAGMWLGKSLGVLFLVITVGCVISLIAGMWNTGRMTVGLLVDVSKGQAAVVEGRVAVSRAQADIQGMARLYGEKAEVHHYVINDEYFEVSMQAYEALAPRQLYRLYYTPRSKLLLSIEPATGSNPKPAAA